MDDVPLAPTGPDPDGPPANEGAEPAETEPREHSELRHLASSAATLASAAAGSAASIARSGLDEVGDLASGARRRIRQGSAARRRQSEPLALLFDVHPDARRLPPRELGIRIVPIERIVGTAVAGSAQRGRDFKPLPQLRGLDWQSRWQRILNAMDRMVVLPPVELLKYGDDHWVLDGHNRVAAALERGQVAVDADVTELMIPGREVPSDPIAAYLQDESRDVRNAGIGRRRIETRGPAPRPRTGDADPRGDRRGADREEAGEGPRS